MRTGSVIGLIAGAGLFVFVVVWSGVTTVAGHLGAAGWGLVLVCLFMPVEHGTSASAWQALFPRARRPGFARAFLATWAGAAVNTLLPVATIGGELVKARLVALDGRPASEALATVVVDKAAQTAVVIVAAVAGIAMAAAHAAGNGLIAGAVGGVGLLALALGGFVFVQTRGAFGIVARALARRLPPDRPDLVAPAEAVDEAIRAIYARPGAIALDCVLRLAGVAVMAGEIVFAAYLVGAPVTLVDALMIKTLVFGLRGVAFAVPGGLGVQEGGFVAIGALIGIPAEAMVAISLATRVREIATGLPALLAWQWREVRALWRRRAGEA